MSRFSVFTALVLTFGWLSFSVELALDFSVRFLVFVIGPSIFFERLDGTFLREVRTGTSFDSEPKLETLFVDAFFVQLFFYFALGKFSQIQFLPLHTPLHPQLCLIHPRYHNHPSLHHNLRYWNQAYLLRFLLHRI